MFSPWTSRVNGRHHRLPIRVTPSRGFISLAFQIREARFQI